MSSNVIRHPAAVRAVFVIVFPYSNSSLAHWSVFFPSPGDPNSGKLLHVIGSPMRGYQHEAKHWDANIATSQRPHTKHFLGFTYASYIVDPPPIFDPQTGKRQQDIRQLQHFSMYDRFERVASFVPAPGVAHTKYWPTGTPMKQVKAWSRGIPGVRTCHDWTKDFVQFCVAQPSL